MRGAAYNTFVQLSAPAIGPAVVEQGMRIRQLPPPDQRKSVEPGLDPFAVLPDLDVVPRNARAERDGVRSVVGVLSERYRAGRDMERPARLTLHVITSYSIHYTKLYEFTVHRVT